MLPRLLQYFRSEGPHLTVEVVRIDVDTGRLLMSGDIDLAFGLVPELDVGYYEQTLYEEDWLCLSSARHPRVGEPMSLERYRAEAHVAIASRSGGMLLAALQRQRIERRVMLELPGFLGLMATLLSTDLIATVPRGIAEALARIAELSVSACPVLVPGLTIKQYWHTRYQHDPGHRWLRTVSASLFLRSGLTTQSD